MSIITLTTGWIDDFHVAALKGILLSAVPSVQIIDISHNAPAFGKGILYAAYIVKHSYSYFPEGSVHIISVASEYSETSPFAAVFHNGHYFVGTDNGIFGLIFESVPEKIVRIEKYKDDKTPNYPAISVFAPAAIHLAKGGDIAELGKPYADYQHRGAIQAPVSESQITGTIIHINIFGNIVTNITQRDFERVGKGRPFEILVQRTNRKITRINRYFHETSDGDLLAVFNVSGLLEIALNKGKLSEIMRIELDTNIIVKFF